VSLKPSRLLEQGGCFAAISVDRIQSLVGDPKAIKRCIVVIVASTISPGGERGGSFPKIHIVGCNAGETGLKYLDIILLREDEGQSLLAFRLRL
jgi:hypothetical protein